MIRRKSRSDMRRMDRRIEGDNRRSDTPPDLNVTAQIKDKNLLLWLDNVLTAGNSFVLRDTVERALAGNNDVNRIIINMEKTTYVDTGGISLLMEFHKRFAAANKAFILFRVTPRVKQILDILNMDKVFNIRDH
ncbi:MAG TPA: STAS domain-containing protein [Candidatus Sumerlaeota bacterium]|mgnify:FL=1|nr:MAG: STAS domain protein [candidate division BRC1 bacterium ADurb.Bin183]HOE62906.1 STAS domain-containing protein [Candidatus Sumerlaeota bacterium]HRR29819.1 STAS domain-containing protein [Candidatus Sumerlaeia bacterium]HON50255.1 STAS domain-containing protein [Candidatus Sumerlaeota bacterium]HOR63472.1 STAS domain-containing protein [Candidatus Sumerlaeota bacterium]